MRYVTVAAVVILTIMASAVIAAPFSNAEEDYAFSNIGYDPETGKVSFGGTFSDDVYVSLHANGYYSGETRFDLSEGSFGGDITVGKLPRGMYRLIAKSVHDPTDNIIGDLRVDGYLFLDSVEYLANTGMVSIRGSSSDRELEVIVRDASDRILIDGAPVVCSEGCSFSSNLHLGTAPSDLKVTVALASESAIHQERTVQVRQVSTASETEVHMFVGSTSTVKLDVVGCTYSEINVYSVSTAIASIEFSTDSGNLDIKGESVGETKIVASVGDSIVEFTIIVEEVPPHESVYTFKLRMDYDYDIADYGESGCTATDMMGGIELSGVGTNAGEALESVLRANNIPCHFWSSEDNSIRYWVDDILGLGDVKMDGGLWKYWIQFQVIDGKESYNQLSLGHYTEGGEFHLLYGITSESGQIIVPEKEDPVVVVTGEGESSSYSVDSKDGKVHTDAGMVSTDKAEMVTRITVNGDDVCTVSNDYVQIALQQQDAVTNVLGADIGSTKVIEVVSTLQNISASLEKDSFKKMADSDVDLRISSSQGSITLGKDALGSLSQKSDVILSFSVVDTSTLTESQKNVIEIGSTVVRLTALSGGQSVGQELGGKVTVVVKHAAVESKDAVAYYIDDEGNRVKVAEQHYDAEKGEMTMVLDHFSVYNIVNENPSDGGFNYTIVTIGVAVVLCLCVVGFVAIKRH